VKEAFPDRYTVDRRGTPDPDNSVYYVLDVVNDLEARITLTRLVRSYRVLGASIKADELESLLDRTKDAFAASVEARNPTQRKKKT
jgi:hypothetical protein